jgi:eukaryotic-like serine/threonine-protein kinase
MTESDAKTALVLDLAEEFLARYRRGERPSLREYTDRHPDLAAEIRQVFPAMAMMERVAVADASLAGDPTAANPAPAVPTVAQLGDYRLIREVGRGGMGVVYEAEQLSLGRHVALKVLPGHGLLNPTYLERFRREAKAAARLHHTNIVPVFGTGEADGTHFYAMQFIRGEGLDRVLADVRRLRRGDDPAAAPAAAESPTVTIAHGLASGTLAAGTPAGPVPPEPSSGRSSVHRSGSEYYRSVARIGVQVADALAYAHKQGVLHRDIKPSNLLLDLQGTVWVTDFGLAKSDGDDLTHTGDFVGTIRYMAPERFDGKSQPESDVYSLGLTLYELLTLRPAFDAANRAKLVEQALRDPPPRPRKIDPNVPRDLETVVLKCVAKDAKDRYRTADELADDLRRFLADRTIRARRATNAELAWRWCRRNPAVASLVGLMVLLLVGVSVASSVAAVRMKRLAADESAARREAEDAGAAERWERYRANVAAASAALQMHNSGAARRALDAAPEAHRNWEWRHLHNQLDGSRAVLRGHDGPVTVAVFSPDGTRVATGAGRAVHLWDAATGRELAVLADTGRITHLAFTHDGTRLAAGGLDGLGLWDATTGARLATLLTDVPARRMDVSADGRHLAACTGGGKLRLWDLATGRETVAGDCNEEPTCLAFRPDGKQVARALGMGIAVWDVDAGREALTLAGGTCLPLRVAYSPDGRRIAAGFTHPESLVRVWDAATGRLLHELRGHANAAVHVAFSPDGRRLASCSMDQTARLWDTETGREVAVLRGHTGTVGRGYFTAGGRRFLSASTDQTLRLWDADTGRLIAVLRGHDGPFPWVSVSPDGMTFVSASEDRTARLWDAALAERHGVLTGHESFVYDVAFSPDGRRVASASWDGTVRLWDPTTGREEAVLGKEALARPEVERIVGGLAFSPDGREVVSVHRQGGGGVTFWDLATGRPRRVVRVPAGSWSGDPRAAYNPSGTLLAVAGHTRQVHVIDPTTGEIRAVLDHSPKTREHLNAGRDLAFSPDGSVLAVARYDGTVHLWDVATRTVRAVLAHPAGVYAVAFSRDGRLLATAATDGAVRLWDPATFQELDVLPHRGRVHAVAFSPDGTRLATGCADNSIRLWDVATRQEVVELRGHADYVHAVAWSPDGTRLVSASGDRTVRVWDSLSVRERAAAGR